MTLKSGSVIRLGFEVSDEATVWVTSGGLEHQKVPIGKIYMLGGFNVGEKSEV